MTRMNALESYTRENWILLLTALGIPLLCGIGIASVVYLASLSLSPNRTRFTMIPERLYEYARSSKRVSSELAKNPKETPGEIARRLYHKREVIEEGTEHPKESGEKPDLERALDCGTWGDQRPSDLFLQIYHDALCSLGKNVLGGVVSPSLMGNHGVVPLTIIAPLPDICRHIANCIARAEKEIFLATNFWVYSDASTLITNAFRELSRRAGERGVKVVVKMLYDRGSLKQLMDNHLRVASKEYTGPKVRLPAPEEIPNIDFDLVNFHRPLLGTFHSKFAVFDRRVALLQSSNIQDNDNLEMMIQVEGPIVDSFYDTALISWERGLEPPLPMLNSPAASAPIPSFSGNITMEASSGTINNLGRLPQSTTEEPHYDEDMVSEVVRVNGNLNPGDGETRREAATCHLNTTLQPSTQGDAPESDQEEQMTPYIVHPHHNPFPMAMVNREPWGSPNHSSIYTPQNVAFIAAINNAKQSIFIQTPDMNAEPILEPLLNAVRRGVIVSAYLCLGYNDAGELLPFQNGTNEMISNRLYKSLKTDEEMSRLRIYNYVAKDQTKPIHNKFKSRSCHIKLMIIDESVAIQGNGNLDTQSFYHSQEVNLLLDSPLICRAWLDAIDRNQNTKRYGLVSPEDGCWHDQKTGKMAEGSMGVQKGKFSWATGVIGAIKRVHGIGGF